MECVFIYMILCCVSSHTEDEIWPIHKQVLKKTPKKLHQSFTFPLNCEFLTKKKRPHKRGDDGKPVSLIWPIPFCWPLLLTFRFSSATEQSTASRLLKRHRRRRKQRPPRLERVRTDPSDDFCFYFADLQLAVVLLNLAAIVDWLHCAVFHWICNLNRETQNVIMYLMKWICGIFLQASSFSSVTDSTMSLNIITVTLNMGPYTSLIFLFPSSSFEGNKKKHYFS